MISLSLIMHPKLEAIYTNCINDIAATIVLELHTLLVWNALPADRVYFSSFAAFTQTIQRIDLSVFLIMLMLLCLGYVYFWVFIIVTCGLIIQFAHAYSFKNSLNSVYFSRFLTLS